MKIQQRITNNLTIELDLTGHALQMALEDGYTPPEEQQTVIKCDVCDNVIPESDTELQIAVGQPIREGYPRSVECPECEGDPYNNSPDHRCDFCRDRGRVDVCRACYDKSLRGEL